MLPRLKYYLRFTLGMTRLEIHGVLLICMIIGIGMGVDAILRSRERQKTISYLDPVRFEVIYTRLEAAQKARSAKLYPKPHYFKATWAPRKNQAWSIDMNAADSVAWVALPGIGPGFAKRILKFKEQLGGFYQVSQLKEVYGMDTVWVERYRTQFRVGAGVYRKLYVNRVLWQEFRHPYLPYAQSKVFLAYRKQHGVVRDFEELSQIKLLDMRVWDRLRPYLAFDP
jgi:DNA uptake protein ComE-like DNA-binding protein